MPIVLAMPVVQIVLFGFVLSRNPQRQCRCARAAIRLNSTANHQPIGYERIFHCYVTEMLSSDSEIDRAFQSGKADMVIAFDNGFGSRIYDADGARMQLMADGAQYLTVVNPPRYYIEMMRLVYLKGATLADLRLQFWALVISDLVLGSWAVLSYRKRE